jgi:hypothetical protein
MAVCESCGSNYDAPGSAQNVGKLLLDVRSLIYWEDYPVGYEETIPGLGEVELVYNSYHNSEGGDIKLVWSTPFGYVGVSGYYSSYSGSRWNDTFEKAEKKTREAIYFE